MMGWKNASLQRSVLIKITLYLVAMLVCVPQDIEAKHGEDEECRASSCESHCKAVNEGEVRCVKLYKL